MIHIIENLRKFSSGDANPRLVQYPNQPMQPSDLSCFNSNSWAEIDLKALAHNVSLLNSFGPDLMAVLKADAYGHSIDIVAPALQELGVRHYGVATVCEGIKLRELLGQNSVNIYVMTAITPSESEAVVSNDLIVFVSSIETLKSLQGAAGRLEKRAVVHMEVDTGIGRAGFQTSELIAVLRSASEMEHIEVSGICTHFTCGEDRDDALGQHALFESVISEIPPDRLETLTIHAANSPAALTVPGARYGMIRPGLLLYGIAPVADNLPEPWQEFPFQPVLSLFSRVILLRDVPAGTAISYGRTFISTEPTRIATIGIGYGDGYPRRLSNIGHVLLPDGIFAPIRGRVCMDQLCVELPLGSDVSEGDIVTMIGRIGDAEIRAVDLAESIGATPHEITTCLTGRVARIKRPSEVSEPSTGSRQAG